MVRKGGDMFNTWQNSFGVDGERNTWPTSLSDNVGMH